MLILDQAVQKGSLLEKATQQRI